MSEASNPPEISKLDSLQLDSLLAQIKVFSCFRGEAEPLFEVIGPMLEGKVLP
jgi:hypothetical protein